ncbi:MAG: RdgB/HAM1 family non-canonical purine NTP pyrophosphatase [Ruminococcus sp.]|nr:RdgB/HAM1 family non-canonical purine NTP pyrophosphatase [Ruminococcus sp.]
MKLIIASGNEGKVREYKSLLSSFGFDEVLSLKEAKLESAPEETGSTFEENAAIKARALHKLCGCAALADDSGLVIDVLDGEPGVYSARWLGIKDDDEKNAEVLRRLEGIGMASRGATFVCAVHFIDSDGSEISARGECRGFIGYEPLGDNGFGYDPIFMYNGRSMAQLTDTEKNLISHRGKALRELVKKLKEKG